MSTGTGLKIFYVITFLVLVLQGFTIYATRHTAYVACRRVANLQNYAILTINRSEKTLPTLDYYKNPDHKDELARQLKFSEDYKRGFPRVPCSADALLP